MKLAYAQLDTHLAKTLAPLYLLSGDDILLVQEGVEAIRKAARAAGYTERTSLSMDSGDEWVKQLYAESHCLSLFASKRIVEMNLSGAKFNVASSKLLQNLTKELPADTLLILYTDKLDSKSEQAAWYKALDKAGVCIPIWPIDLTQLPTWIMQRSKKRGLSIAPDAAKRLAELVEGNLLAASQEIEKLLLLNASKTVDIALIETTVADHARFDIFGLVESALLGNAGRSLRILANLKAEDAEPILILWALTRELRMLTDMAKQLSQGANLSGLFSQYRIWEKRQPGIKQFLQKHKLPQCWALLSKAAHLDRLLKGAATGDIWLTLEEFVLQMAGSDIIQNTTCSF